ncbi:MAG: Ig-like domain-containing protein [Pseudolabrys sp.]
MSYRLLALAALLALLPASARAGCTYRPFEFHPEKNDGVVVDVIVDAGSFCTHNFGRGQGYTFNGIDFAHKPEHGKVEQAGDKRFIYTPNKGFTGKDAYVFHICASKGGQQGCSTVAFVAQVK